MERVAITPGEISSQSTFRGICAKLIRAQDKPVEFSNSIEEIASLIASDPEYTKDPVELCQYIIEIIDKSSMRSHIYDSIFDSIAINNFISNFREIEPNPPIADGYAINEGKSNILKGYCTKLISSFKISQQQNDFSNEIAFVQQEWPIPWWPKECSINNDEQQNTIFPAKEVLSPRCISSNGRFLFVIHTHSSISVYPIFKHGILLPPFERTLDIKFTSRSSISSTEDNIIIETDKRTTFSISDIIKAKEGSVKPLTLPRSIENCMMLTDGVSKVDISLNSSSNITIETSSKAVHTFILSDEARRLASSSIENNQLVVETNGCIATFIAKGEDEDLSFTSISLISGKKIQETKIKTKVIPIAATIDIINRVRWVVVENERKLIIKSFPYEGPLDPFQFELNVPNFPINDSRSQFMNALSISSLSAFGMRDLPSGLRLGSQQFNEVLTFLNDLLQNYYRDEFDPIIQAVVLVIFNSANALNKSHPSSVPDIARSIKSTIKMLLQKNISRCGEYSAMLMLCSTENIIENRDLKSVMDKCNEKIFDVLISSMGNSTFLASNFEILRTYIEDDKWLSDFGKENNKLLKLLLQQQNAIVSNVKSFIKSDIQSSTKDYNKPEMVKSPPNFLREYSYIVCDCFLKALIPSINPKALVNSVAYHLFINFLEISTEIYEFSGSAQAILPMIVSIPSAINSYIHMFSEQTESIQTIKELLIKVCFYFGLFAATLMRGGNDSEFDKRYNWIIRANLDLSNTDTFRLIEPIPEDKLLLSQDQMNVIYQNWKANCHANINDKERYLDRLTLSVLARHYGDKETQKIIDFVNLPNNNTAPNEIFEKMYFIRKKVKDYESKRNSKYNLEKLYFLMRIKSQFESGAIKAKKIADFALSNDEVNSLMDNISTQKIRGTFTEIGFGVVQEIFKNNLPKEANEAISFGLSTLENFDPLSSVFHYLDNAGMNRISNFIKQFLEVSENIQLTGLTLVAFKLLKVGSIPETIASDYLNRRLSYFIKNRNSLSDFAICFSNHRLISKTLEPFGDSMQLDPLCLSLISNIITNMKQCSPALLERINNYALTCEDRHLKCAMDCLYNAMKYANIDEIKYEKYLNDIFDSIKASFSPERVEFMDRILLDKNQISAILINILEKVTINASNYSAMCALFSILGGSCPRIHPFCRVETSEGGSWIYEYGKQPMLYRIPLSVESKSIPFDGISVIPKHSYDFDPYSFPHFEFIISFFDFCMSQPHSLLSILYAKSFSTYAKIPEFVSQTHISQNAISRLFSFSFSSFDNLYHLYSKLSNLGEITQIDALGDFDLIRSPNNPYVTYISKPGICGKFKITCQSMFIGCIGLTDGTNCSYIDYEASKLEPEHRNISLPIFENNCVNCTLEANRLQIGDVKIDRKSLTKMFIASKSPIVNIESMNAVFKPSEIKPEIQKPEVKRSLIDKKLLIVRSVDSAESRIEGEDQMPAFKNLIEDCPIILPQAYPFLLKMSNKCSVSANIIEDERKGIICDIFDGIISLIVVRLINCGKLGDMPKEQLAKLFSILLSMLEPFYENEFLKGSLPFNPAESVINDNPRIHQINFGYSKECQCALQRIHGMQQFASYLQKYVSSLMASPSLHLGAGSNTAKTNVINNIAQFSENADEVGHLLIAFPKFNSSMNITAKVSGNGISFPAVVDGSSAKLIFDQKFESSPIYAIKVMKKSNSWVIGTSVEILLLLKYLSQMKEANSFFVRSTLIDLVLVQSPFAWPFLAKSITSFTQSSRIADSCPVDYFSRVLQYGSFISSRKAENEFSFFFDIEKGMISSSYASNVSNIFPELYNIQPKQNSDRINFNVPFLDYNPCLEDAVSQLHVYSTILARKSQISDIPIGQILPFWIALIDERQIGCSMSQQSISLISDTTIRIDGIRVDFEISMEDRSEKDGNIDISFTEGFENETIFSPDDLPRQIHSSNSSAFISLINIPGNFRNVSIKLMKQVDFVPSKDMRQSFIHDIRDFATNQSLIPHLLNTIPPEMLKQNSFSPIRSLVSKSMPELLTALFLHRINYIVDHFSGFIPSAYFSSIKNYVSTDIICNIISSHVAITEPQTQKFFIDRHCLQGLNNKKKSRSIISQFSEQLSRIGGRNLRSRKTPWKVYFDQEAGIDLHGLMRELFSELEISIFAHDSDLFTLSSGENKCYIPFSSIGADALSQYYAIGVFIGVALRCGYSLNLPFAPFVWKYLTNEPITESDITNVDSHMNNQIRHLREIKSAKNRYEWMTHSWDGKETPLGNVMLSENGVEEFIEAYVGERISAVVPFLEKMKNGFSENVGFDDDPLLISSILSMIVQGKDVVTTKDLRKITEFQGFSDHPEVITYFWEAVDQMTNENRSLLLRFITGLPRIPNEAANEKFQIKIRPMYKGDDYFPASHTCYLKMDLPFYSSAQIAYQQIFTAITKCKTQEFS